MNQSRQFHLWVILALGIVSGLPFLLTLSTLSFWLAESGVSKTEIGLFVLVSLPYSLKFLWAPLLDHLSLPYVSKRFGQRRSWAFLSQVGLMCALVHLAYCEPEKQIVWTWMFAFLVSFFSASQDIIIDAYRIEILQGDFQGVGAALESVGFRLGMLASGAGTLYLAHKFGWKDAYLIMAFSTFFGMMIFSLISEPLSSHKNTSSGFKTLFLLPWQTLPKKKHLLIFIFCFKIGDTVLNAMGAPFFYDLGLSKIEFANITKVFGISLTLIGGFSGGLFIHRYGLYRSAFFCVFLQGIASLCFMFQAFMGYQFEMLVLTVGVESFCSGMVSTIFIAYISHFCQKPYTASHFTLFYSFGSLCRVLTSALAGLFADYIGWIPLFFITSGFVIPAVYMLTQLSLEDSRCV